MLYTDVSVSLMQNFVAILLIFLLYRYIQRKITFKRIILDILIAIIFFNIISVYFRCVITCNGINAIRVAFSSTKRK